MIRVGIVGAGGIGTVHARQYRKRNDVELFFYDRNAERSEAFVKAFDAERVDTYENLLEKVDVVDICLPTPSHAEAGLKAIAMGLPLLIEKPLALTVEEAVSLVEAASKAGVVMMPAFVLRYFPEYRKAHNVVVKGDIGKPAAARMRRGAGAPSGSDGWFMDIEKSGGVLLDLCIHDFDWLQWTMGEVKFLYSRSVAQKAGVGPDYALTTITYENGCVAHVEGTWMDPGGFRTQFDIAGSEGLIQFDSRQNVALRTTVAAAPGAVPLPNMEGGQFPTEDPYYLEIDGFLKAVVEKTDPPVTGLDGLRAVSTSWAAIESARTDKVTVPARHF